MAVILAVSYIVMFAISVLLFNMRGKTKRQDDILWSLFILSLAVIAFCFEPEGSGLDIERHWERILLIQQTDISFGNFLFENSYGYQGLYVFNAICYLIAKLSVNRHVLPFLVAAVSYSISFYIMRDWAVRENIPRKYYALSILINFSFLPYYMVVGGIRNGVASCIMALAVYLYLYRRKNILVFSILCVTSMLIHISVIIVIPFVILSKVRVGIRSGVCIVLVSSLCGLIANKFATLRIPYLSELAKSYLLYSSDGQFRSAQYFVITDISLIVIFLVVLFFQYESKVKTKEIIGTLNVRMYNFVMLYGLYIIGNLKNYDLVLRPAYLFGPLAPILVCLFYNKTYWGKKRSILVVLKLLVSCISLYTVMRYMTYFISVVSF